MKPGNLVKLNRRIDESDENLFGFILEIVALKDRKTDTCIIYTGEEIKVLWHTSLEKSKWRGYNGCISSADSKNLEVIG